MGNTTTTTSDSASAVERLPMPVIRASVSRVVVASSFASIWANLVTGAVYTSFARGLGANDRIFGTLAAVGSLMCVLQVFSARLVERTGRKKAQAIIGGIVARGVYMAIAALPLLGHFLPGVFDQGRIIALMIGLILLSGAFGSAVSPAYFAWMTDLVPSAVRPSFFARCLQLGTVMTMVAMLLSTLIADKFPYLWVYSIVIGIGGFFGALSMFWCMRVKEPAPLRIRTKEERKPTQSPLAAIIEPLRDRSVQRFLAFACCLYTSYTIQNTFLYVHCMENLHFSKTVTSLILSIAPLLAMAGSARFWGNLSKKHGNRPVMRIASFGLTLIPVGWLLAGPNSAVWLFLLIGFSGALGGALDLSACNLITCMSPHISRSSLTACYNISVGLVMALVAFLCGEVAQWLHGFHFDLYGRHFTNYHILFVAALVVRGINALYFAPRLYEPASDSTLATVQDVVPVRAQPVVARVARPVAVRV